MRLKESQALQAFRAMLTEAGLDGDAAPVESEVSEVHGGYEAARRILAREARPTGFFCYNDRMAMGAYRAAAELGLSIPADLSVVGFDDQDLIAANLHPGLSTVAMRHYEMALHPTILGCRLVRRASIAAPRQ